MKILYLINRAAKAGAEKYVLNLVQEYNDKRAKCYFAYNIPGYLSEQMAERKISTFQFDMKGLLDLKAAKTLARICRENKIDIIHVQYPKELYIALFSRLLCKRKIKIVFTSHLTYEDGLSRRFSNRLVASHADRIISICTSGKEQLCQNGYPRKKISVIPYGIVPNDREKIKSEIRKELGISDDIFVISTLARFHASKGLEFLIDSIEKLCKIIKRDFVLLVAGEGELFEEIKIKVEEKGLSDKVKLLGFRKDAYNILFGSDLYVNSSMSHESLSLAILEALNVPLPVVATNVGGNSDIVNDETGCGKLVEYADTTAMAQAIRMLAEDASVYEECRTNCAKTIREKFNPERIYNEIFEVYTNLIKKN